MQKNRSYLAAISIAFVLTLCSCATTANYEKILQSWVGVHSDDLIASWGPPQNSYQLSNGGAVIEYFGGRTVPIGGYTYSQPQTTYHSGTVNTYSPYGRTGYGSYSGTSTTYVQKQTPVYNIPMQCRTTFTVNSSGIITSWRWQGNDCKALPPE